ncbi:transglycosylase SLT domain-containing protein [Pseudomonas sp. NPDC089569]|uniref:transglycosylase SLT domain-containing protein n=1 Tax=Pseudomonas sp. NPDC089569 TaxID=3390722 RepID=UPI003D0884D2
MSVILSWDVNPQRSAWSRELLEGIESDWVSLESGSPDKFVFGYSDLSSDNKKKFWAEIIIKMIAFESGFDPHCIYKEPPPLGVDSVGLLQLSYEDEQHYSLEPLSREEKSLEDPWVNIRCGLKIFSHWLARDKVVAQGSGGASRGAARYWSVLREGQKHHLEEIRSHARASVGL